MHFYKDMKWRLLICMHRKYKYFVLLVSSSFNCLIYIHTSSLRWCIWCQRLHPTWEKFGEEVHKLGMPVGVGKVNCVIHAQLCKDQKVMAFPTLRWYKGGEAILPDYKMDRTVAALTGYAKDMKWRLLICMPRK